MKKFLFVVLTVAALTGAALAQEAPKFLGGGFNLATNTSATVGGGYVEGNYPFLSIFEFKGQMAVDSNSRYSFFKNTTINFTPEMRMFVPLNKKVEAFVAGGVDSQMLTGGIQDYFNPKATVGLRFVKAYDISFSRLFDTMNTQDAKMTGFRFSGNVFRPVRSNLALIAGFDFDKQLYTPVPSSQFKARVGLAIK